MKNKSLAAGILGHAIGDALGVPHEFKDRSWFKENPVTGMDGYGTHNQPPGTWSDDTSLSLCLAESLLKGFDLKDIANNFVKWYDEAHLTAHGAVFDIGNATHAAISRIKQGVEPAQAGGKSEYDNGNGSLMRILPLLAYIYDKDPVNSFSLVSAVSGITHGHLRSKIACSLYLVECKHLLQGHSKNDAYASMRSYFRAMNATHYDFYKAELVHFLPLFEKEMTDIKEDEIDSSGYVVNTLMASIWCFVTTESYKDAVLKAVNLGDDTDTIAAVTGGMAGIYYGMAGIPGEWLEKLVKREEIEQIAIKFNN